MENDDARKKRREFLKSLAGLTAGMMLPITGRPLEAAISSMENPNRVMKDRMGELLPQRKFGNTGKSITMLGLGGAHIARMSDAEAEKTIERAIEGGVRFFDNAESYGSGEGERKYGRFLTPKYRDIAFIQTKTTSRDAKTAKAHLEGTLSRMKTDYLDLYYIHAVTSPSDVDNRIKNGVLDVLLEAKESGKVKHIGFSGHSDYKAHIRMLESTDTMEACQMPINAYDPNYKSFINNVLPILVEKGIAPIAMKTLANGGFFGGTSHFNHGSNPRIVPAVLSVQEAVHFSWSMPISTLVTGADDAKMLDEKIGLAKTFKAMDESQRQQLVEKVANFDGKLVEFYKV
ncbi:aldo/keto reductase [Pleomorphovibrio marinus]|uniref:aldo/keto reductase n=1 Tax=Pleomorphovibrio marinus TaxID=2164132 RepID=UPI000E0AD402|nr:aldo/keto reductase [Pleomorphovibrio marinus]